MHICLVTEFFNLTRIQWKIIFFLVFAFYVYKSPYNTGMPAVHLVHASLYDPIKKCLNESDKQIHPVDKILNIIFTFNVRIGGCVWICSIENINEIEAKKKNNNETTR